MLQSTKLYDSLIMLEKLVDGCKFNGISVYNIVSTTGQTQLENG